jgi:hypothetical protein
VWRAVTSKTATLQEIEEFYSIDDLADLNDVLDGIARAQEPR